MTVIRSIGPTILLNSGRYFNLEDPENSEFTIEDIAHALSHICRYTGQCRTFYSVAQHSVMVSRIVPPKDALAGLLHDAAEAFIGDVSRPLKLLLPDYKKIEQRVENAVLGRFGVDSLPPSVKYADIVLLRTEQRDLMDADEHQWVATAEMLPLPDRILPVGPEISKAMFLDRYAELTQNTELTGAASMLDDEVGSGEIAWQVMARQREAFEFCAAVIFRLDITRLGAVYLKDETRAAWEAWQEAGKNETMPALDLSKATTIIGKISARFGDIAHCMDGKFADGYAAAIDHIRKALGSTHSGGVSQLPGKRGSNGIHLGDAPARTLNEQP